VKGLKTADTDALALLQKKFNLDGKKIKLVIGERGDKAVKKYDALIPQKNEGYYLSISPEEVVIAGNDERGTYYGTQTFLQIASGKEVMCVTVSDYPDVATRGMVEGYYGNPYSEEDRKSMFEFFGKQKMNTYIYGPKDDIYHRAKWREEYPAAEAAKIAEYAKVAKANKVDFVWAIHPGNDIKWNRTDSLNMIKKLNAMYELGIRTYAVFFDDIWGEGTDATRQAGLLNYISDEFVKKHSDVAPLILCPTQYNKGWSSGDYLDILGEKSYTVTVPEEFQVYVNGELLDEPYVIDRALGECDIKFPFHVTENHYFILGDHRSTSIDSRSSVVGLVSSEQIVGRIFFRIWPFDKMGSIEPQGNTESPEEPQAQE
jgi:hyaluronoglucosaminidase